MDEMLAAYAAAVRAKDVDAFVGLYADDVRTCLPGGSAAKAAGLYRPGVPFRVLVEEAERVILQESLTHHGGQMAATARATGPMAQLRSSPGAVW